MKKILILLFLLFITGCDKSDIKKTYENMQNSSYEVDIKLNGVNENNRINDSTRITNYKNKEYKIIYINDNKLIYKFNNKFYIKEKDSYKKINENFLYTNLNLYLDLLNEVKKINSKTKETINDIEYSVYNVNINKSVFTNVLNDTSLKDKNVSGDAICNLYITKEKKLYRTKCNLKNNSNIKLDITYFNINKVSKIK